MSSKGINNTESSLNPNTSALTVAAPPSVVISQTHPIWDAGPLASITMPTIFFTRPLARMGTTDASMSWYLSMENGWNMMVGSAICNMFGELVFQQFFYDSDLLIDPCIHIPEFGFDYAATPLDHFIRFEMNNGAKVIGQEQFLF